MASPVVQGRTTPIALPEHEETRADSSKRKEGGWEGVPAGMETKYTEEVASGDWDLVRLERGRVVSRIHLEVEEPAADASLEEGVRREWWELDRNLVDLPLRMHPYFLGAGYLDVCDRYLRTGKDPSWGTADLVGAAKVDKVYYYSRKAGQESVPYSTYVVRRVRIVTAGTIAKSDHSDVMTVVPLPGRVPSAIIGAIPGDFEWLKQPPDVRNTERRRYEMTQEYWGGMPNWSIIYGGTWDPSDGH